MPQSGIYRIVNSDTGACYVGSAIDVKKRRREHLHALRHNKHHSPYLQRSFNIHGEAAFVWELLEEIEPDRDKLFERETYWVQMLQPLYNASTVSATRLGVKLTPEQCERVIEARNRPDVQRRVREPQIGRQFSEDHKAKIKEARARQETTPAMLEALKQGQEIRKQVNPSPMLGKTHSEKTLQRMSESAFARAKPTEETCKILSEAAKNRVYTEAGRQKRSESMKARWAKRKAQQQQLQEPLL